MNYDDIIYVSLLLFSILFGYVFNQIKDINLKKFVGTFIGLCIVIAVSGIHVLHPLIAVTITIIVIYTVPIK